MAAPKGNKFAGSRKGIPNKKTAETLKRVEYVLGLLDENIESDIKSLEPRERVKMWEALQEFVRAKIARVELTGGDGGAVKTETVLDLKKLTLEQLEAIKGAIKDTDQ